MRQISVLKKQYRDDLEKLTQSYEGRRKALKDALLSLSSDGVPVKGAGQKDKMSSVEKGERKKGV